MSDSQDELAVLARVPSEAEAAMLVASLSEAGLSARADGALTAGFRAEAPGDVRVLVHEEDLPKAKEALEAVKQHNREIDWSQVDLGEPE